MPVIKGNKTEQQDISGTGKTWTVAANAKVQAPDIAIFEDSESSGQRLKILGTVTGVVTEEFPASTAVFTFGLDTEIDVAKSAKISGRNGIISYGEGSDIDNAGKVTANGGLGIELFIFDGGGSVTNSGKITGETGVYVYGSGSSVTNEKGGKIVGQEAGVQMLGTGGDGHKLTNSGSITGVGGDSLAVFGSDYADTVINRGTIKGAIDLGDGADRFEFRGGKLNRSIAGGEGDDLLITNKASVKLFEQADDGFDTVRSTVSYVLGSNVDMLILVGKKSINGTGSDGDNDLNGNAKTNSLKGRDGNDWLDGGKGKDTLNGGDDVDTFELAKGTGKDTVTDFEDGIDLIFVTGYADFNEPADVDGQIEKHGADTWVRMSKKDILVLKGVDADLIDGDDFTFVM